MQIIYLQALKIEALHLYYFVCLWISCLVLKFFVRRLGDFLAVAKVEEVL